MADSFIREYLVERIEATLDCTRDHLELGRSLVMRSSFIAVMAAGTPQMNPSLKRNPTPEMK